MKIMMMKPQFLNYLLKNNRVRAENLYSLHEFLDFKALTLEIVK